MEFPYMLIMRNSYGGCIWQAYEVRDEKEVELLTKTATHNGFLVQKEPAGYIDETTPGWRDSQEWKDYRAGKLSGRALGQQQCREILKDIRRDGPYWLGGYHDWLVSTFSLRSPDDLQGFTPIACWSEIIKTQACPSGLCMQYMVCIKDGQYYVDVLGSGQHGINGYGLAPTLATEQTYPPHIYDWIFKDVLPTHRGELPAPAGPIREAGQIGQRAEIPAAMGNDAPATGSYGDQREVPGHARRKPARRRVAQAKGLRGKVAKKRTSPRRVASPA